MHREHRSRPLDAAVYLYSSSFLGLPYRILYMNQRLHSSSFLGLPYRILYMNPQKELLWSLRVTPRSEPSARISSQIDGSAALREDLALAGF